MAKQARGSSRTVTAKAPVPKTALAVEPAADESPEGPSAQRPAEKPAAEKPAVALVPDAPAEQPKRGRPPGTAAAKVTRKVKVSKAAKKSEILALVETGEESGQFVSEPVNTVTELLDLMDEGRKVYVTRTWREF